MNRRTLAGLVLVALIGITLVFSTCGKRDEPAVDVAEREVEVSEDRDFDASFDINFDPTVARDRTCNNTGCAVKKSNQALTVRVCAANMAGAQQAAGQRANQTRAAVSVVETACAPFSCPTPNPCTTAGENCNPQAATATARTFGAPTCVNTGQQGNCAAGQTEWDCTYARANVSGSKNCRCT